MIGETTHKDAEIREATAGDLIEATEESEKVVLTPDGYQLVASPTMVGLNTLRRQIVRIGEYPGPLTLTELKKLSSKDISLLQEQAEIVESVSLKEFADRGRADQAPA
jgi:phage FluMu protein gp41